MSDLIKRVNAVMNDVGAISKDKENPHFRYMYVSAEAVRARVQKACVKHGLILRLTYSDETVSLTSALLKCTCSVSMDGSTFVVLGEGWGAGMDKSEKACLKANTSAAKYALANAFCIALGDDPEADAETDQSHAPEPKTPAYKRPPSDHYSGYELQRAEAQAASAKAICDGFISLVQATTHVDDVMAMLDEHIGVIDAMGHVEIKRFGSACVAHIETGVVEGMTATGFREAFRAAQAASRKAARNGAG